MGWIVQRSKRAKGWYYQAIDRVQKRTVSVGYLEDGPTPAEVKKLHVVGQDTADLGHRVLSDDGVVDLCTGELDGLRLISRWGYSATPAGL
jgi:hypothetical protein